MRSILHSGLTEIQQQIRLSFNFLINKMSSVGRRLTKNVERCRGLLFPSAILRNAGVRASHLAFDGESQLQSAARHHRFVFEGPRIGRLGVAGGDAVNFIGNFSFFHLQDPIR